MDGCLIILSLSTLWMVKKFFLLFSDLFYDIKFLLVHTLCEWLITYPLSSLFFLFDNGTCPTFEHQRRSWKIWKGRGKMYLLCAHPLENEGRKGGGQIKDSIRHLPQNIPVHWWFCLLCHCLLANIIYEGSNLLLEKRSRQQIPVTGSFQRAELLARWVQGACGQLTLVIQIYVQVRFVNLINGFSLCGLYYWSSFLTYLQINITYNNVSLKYVVCMFSR